MPRKRSPSILDDLWHSLAGGVVGATGGAAQGAAQVQEELERGVNAVGKLSGRTAPIVDADATALRSIAQDLATSADEQRAQISPGGREAMAASTPRGNLFAGEFDLGEDPSARGYALNIAQGLGSVVPNIVAAAATRGRSVRTQAAVGATVGGLTGGGFAAQDEGARIRAMDEAGFQAQFAGQDRETVARAAETGAFRATAPVSAVGGALTSGLVGKPAQALLGRVAGTGRVARAATTGTIGSVEEGLQEVGEGAAQRAGATAATGETGRELGTESAANLVLGATTGGPMSGGLAALTPPSVIQPERGVISRAAARGVETGVVQNAEVEHLNNAGDGGLVPDLPPGADLGPGTELVAPAAAPVPVTRALIDRGNAGFVIPTGYTRRAPPRDPGEHAIAYAKRAIDTLPPPRAEHLPRDPWAYFEVNKADQLVPIEQLVPSKKDRTGETALRRLAASADGAIERRKPLEVELNADGTYTVLDGNGTLAAAKMAGFSALPVRIAKAPEGQEAWRIDRGYLDPEQSQALTREYELATAARPSFEASVNEIADTIGASVEYGDIKHRNRAEQKTAIDYRGDTSKINDLLRTTLEADSLEQAQAILAETGARFQIIKNKNALDPSIESPYVGGYRDAKLVVITPEGAKAEVQVNLKPMLEAKHKAHRLYDQWRNIDAKVVEQGGVPTPAQRAELQRLEAAQRAIYEPAWAAVTKATKAASSTTTPLRPTVSLENARGSAVSNANTPPSSPLSATGTPSTSKNRVPGGNLVTDAAPAVVQQDDSTGGTGEITGLDRREPVRNLRQDGRAAATDFGVIVAPKPGTKVEADGRARPYDRAADGANLPPAQASVQKAPDLAALQERALAIFKRPAAAAALRKHFGIKGLKLRTIRGAYEGEPELSFALSAEGLEGENARQLAVFLGMAFSQDAVIVTKPDPVGPAEDSIPTIDIRSTGGAKLADSVFEAVTAQLRERGIDYSEADGAIRVLHFGDEAGFESLATSMLELAVQHGLAADLLHTRSELYEAQDYRRHLQEGGTDGGAGRRPEVLRALVDHFLVPYVHAIGSVGYQFDAGRFAQRYGLEEAEAAYLSHALSAAARPRSTVPLLAGQEPHGLTKATNFDAAYFLSTRAAAFGQIDPRDRSATAREVIAETLAQEIEYQLNKPEGKQAIGWYDRQLKKAMAIMGQAFPDIVSDREHGIVFLTLLATTSQGLDVVANFNTASKLFARWKETGKIDRRAIALPGKAAPIIEANLEKIAALFNRLGITKAGEFLAGEHTVRELKAMGYKDVSGLLDAKVRGWMIFGPKIGSFGNNLDGDFDTLTADLWFSRTWNRVLGNMFQYSPEREAKNIRDFRTALVQELNDGSNKIINALSDSEREKIGQLEFDYELARRLYRDLSKGFKDRSPLNRAAKNWVENVEKLQDVPRGDPERRWQNEIMRAVQDKVAARTGNRVTVADMQALLWYQEKELFRLLGAANARSAPLDYADAAQLAADAIVPEGVDRRADDDATMIDMAYPLGQDYLLGKLGKLIKDARLVVTAGTPNAVYRVAVDRKLTADEKIAVLKIGGVKRTMPGTFPTVGKIEAAIEDESTPPRFQVPASTALQRHFRELDRSEQAKVDGAIAQLRKAGYPKEWLQLPTFFFAHNSSLMFTGRFYLRGEEKGAISLRHDTFQRNDTRLIEDLAHEIAHAADFDPETGGFYSLTSSRFELEVDNVGDLVAKGDVIRELILAWQKTPLGETLKYPFAEPDLPADIIVPEAFAQAVALYATQNAALKKHAPITHAMLKELFDAKARGARRGPDPLQSALLHRGSRKIAARDVQRRADRRRGPGDRGERDSGRAQGGADRPGAVKRALVMRIGSEKPTGVANTNATNLAGMAALLGEIDQSDGSISQLDRPGATIHVYEIDAPDGDAGDYRYVRKGADNGRDALPEDHFGAKDVGQHGGRWYSFGGVARNETPVFSVSLDELRKAYKARYPESGLFGSDPDRDQAFAREFFEDKLNGPSFLGNDGEELIKLGSRMKGKNTPARAMALELRKITKPNPFGGNEFVFFHGNGGAFGAVELNTISGRDDALWLSAVRSFAPGTGNGYGSYVLGKVLDLADKYGVTLQLAAEPFGAKNLNKKQLMAWYARHGFKPKRGIGGGAMERAPQVDGLSNMGMPPASAAFDGYTIPSWEFDDHLRGAAGRRLDAYKGAAKGVGDKLRTLFQDYFLPVRRVQEAITAAGGEIDEDSDVYGREEVYYGRTGEQLRQLEETHVKPLVKAMVAAGVRQEEFELYLYAKFAPKRNERIAAINPRFPDGGSGMTNADAAQVLADFQAAGLTPKLEALAKRVRDLNAVRVDTLEQAGLLSAGEAELWRAEPDYVPLKGFIDRDGSATRQPTGQGFSIGGREAHMALGRKSRATDILANAIAQTEQAIIRAEKNRVATALLRLAQANPNESLWTVDKIPEQPVLSPNGEVTYRKNNLHRLADNVVSVKVDGEQHFVTLHDERLAASMKNLGAAKMGAFLRAFSSFNRFLSLTRTMLAPEFVLANFSRDLQTAAINLTGDQSTAMAARVLRDVPKAVRAMYAFNRGKDPGGEWSRWAKEFTAAGGMTSFVGQQTVEEQQAKIEGLLKDAKGGTRAATRKLVRGVFEFVEDVNGAVENATRLAAYANARRNGQSAQAAARLAKNLTVNFNRKGSAGPTINALYLFYNASIQGTTRFLRAMKSPKVQGIMASTAVFGFALASMNRAMGGDDDDGEDRWDKIPEWEKARNLIILLPEGKTIKVPLPYSYNLPFLMGSEIEAMVNSKREPSSAAANIVEALLTSFSPVGDIDLKGDSSVAAAKVLAPSAVDPLVDIAVNRNFFGAPIAPERNPFDKTPEPDSQRYFASTNPGAVWLADKLNTATGGDKLRPGLIDISPASMVYVFDYLTGGTGGFVERSVTAITLAAKGEPVPLRTVPFLRVFAGELSERRVTDTFYRLREDVNIKAELAKLARGQYGSEGERRDALLGRRLGGKLKAAERQLATLRALRKKALATGDDERAKRLQEREMQVQLRFNRAYFQAQEALAD